jgi:hypothetical protein
MKWIAGLLLGMFSVVANAQVLVTANKGGGEIVLSKRKCTTFPDAGLLFDGYTYTNGSYERLCWALVDGLVHVVFEGGERRAFPLGIFQLRGDTKQ